MAAESKIEKPACEAAPGTVGLSVSFKTHNNKGAPDRMFMKAGNVLFVEFKDPDGYLSKLQIYEHKQYAKKGVKVHVIDSIEDFKTLIAT